MTSNVAVNGGTVNGGQSHIDDILVKGISDPEAPTDILLSNSSIYVNTKGGSSSSGTVLGNLSSTDFNLGNTFTYSLEPGSGSTFNCSFSLAGNILSTAAILLPGLYSIRVRSTDNSTLFYEKILIIKVVEPNPVTEGSRQRISLMGTSGSTAFNATAPANICYNSTDNEYLSVWQADDNTSPSVDNEFEIYGQRINANTGLVNGLRIRISFMGPDANTSYRGLNPSVAYNATNNEYFVVWQGDLNTGSLVQGEDEIWGQRLNASTGALLGSMVRISAMGPNGNNAFDAQNPDVSWNSVNNQYLVVWRADDNTSPMIDNEYEIYGQLLVGNTGVLSGSKIRISTMGPNGSTAYQAFTPVVTYNGADNRYLVVWRGDDNTESLVDDDFEIFGQRLTATGSFSASRIRISTMGPDGNIAYAAQTPDVTWNSTQNKYYVVWSADDISPLIDNENEIFGQALTNLGVLSGSRARLSDMGPDGNASYDAINPKVVYSASLGEYWVVWAGDDDYTSIDNENEIFFQRVNYSGAEIGDNDIRLSYMGPMSNTAFSEQQPAIAYNSTDNKGYVVWTGDDNTAPLVDNENEVFGQSMLVMSVLPVTWISFSAEMQSKQTVLLNWKTASEWNTKDFTIQRSSTTANWNNIGTQVATNSRGNSSDYNFTDTKPMAGKNYYRLLQNDQDGVTSFSKVVLIDNSELSVFTVFPNPAVTFLTVQLPKTGSSTLKLFDNAGRLVQQDQFNGRNFVLDVKGITPGIYHLQISQQGIIYNRKFVKK
ncbi:MAG: T9SS type A sorting domain-containing protein [Chitinophagaceae bacterium]